MATIIVQNLTYNKSKFLLPVCFCASFKYYRKDNKRNNTFPLRKSIQEVLKSSKPLRDPNTPNLRPGKDGENFQIPFLGDFKIDRKQYEKMTADDAYSTLDIDSEGFEDVLENEDFFYDTYKMEKKDHFQLKHFKNIERKCFKPPLEPCLLTWAAKEQIHYLHRLDPDEWTHEALAEQFAVSVPGVKKLLRNLMHGTSDIVKRHDEKVSKLWKEINKGKIENLHEALQERWHHKKLKKDLSKPNPNLPLPPPKPKNSPFQIENPSGKVGEFYALVKPYLDLTKQKEQQLIERSSSTTLVNSTHSAVVSTRIDVHNEAEEENDWVTVRTSRTLTEDVDADELQLEKEERENNKEDLLTYKQFETKLIKEMEQNPSEENRQILNWLTESKTFKEQKTNDTVASKKQMRKNFNTENSNLSMKHVEKYKTERHTGNWESLDHIIIDDTTEKVGDLYRVGDSFYDQNGEFLYKPLTNEN